MATTTTKVGNLKGPAGPAGPTGPSGTAGTTGTTGATGPRGYSFTSGSGSPSTSVISNAIVGDTYMDVTTGDVYSFS